MANLEQNTQQTVQPKPSNNKGCLPAFLGGLGFALAILAASTEDFRDEREYANEMAGKEIYTNDDLASKKTTNAMTAGAFVCLGGAIYILLKRENQNGK